MRHAPDALRASAGAAGEFRQPPTGSPTKPRATARFGVFSVGADWFEIELSDVPALLSPQPIVDLNAAGTLPPGASVVRDGDCIARIESSYVQGGETQIEGVELRTGAAWNVGSADLTLDVRGVRVIRYEERVAGLEQPGDTPRDRVHASLLAAQGGLTASWNLHAVSSVWNAARTGRYESWKGHDVALRWRGLLGIGRLCLVDGVLNVGDQGPSTNPANLGQPLLRLDSVMGLMFFLTVTLPFSP